MTDQPEPSRYAPPERGPIQTYEVTWINGHTEHVEAHQVSFPGSFTMFGEQPRDPRIAFHGEIDGHWRLVLTCREADVRTVRNITSGEHITPEVTS